MRSILNTAGVAFTVRDYRRSDFARLWQIDQLCFPEGIAYSQEELRAYIAKANGITLIGELTASGGDAATNAPAQSAERIVGFVTAHAIRRRYGRILTLDILPHARRLGLASKLMEECERRLSACGCREVYLETAVNNQPALRLYRKLGYEVLGTLPEYYSSHSLDAFQMGKRL